MSHISLQDAHNWLELNGKGVSANEMHGISLSSVAETLELYPDISFAEIKRLSNTDPRALTSSEAAGAKEFQAWARDMLYQFGADNNTLTFFIDRGGNLPFNGDPTETNPFSNQLTITPGEDIVEFIRQTMAEYEALTGGTVRFEEVNDDDLATISFYYSKEVVLPEGGTLLGMSTDATNGIGGKWRNIFYNSGGAEGLTGSATIKNTIVHEMGHTIGFSHPYDLASEYTGSHAGDGYNSAYNYKDSIMSYNRINPMGSDLTESDENAYRYIWQSFGGSEDLASASGKSLRKADVFGLTTTAIGGRPSYLDSLENQSRDYITGLSGPDLYVGDQSDDTWHGGDGNDKYLYKGGFDFASGGDGEDSFYIDPLNANGYLTINDFTDGQDKLVFQSDDDYSVFAFGGATFVLASDTDKVVFLRGEFTEQQLFGDADASPLLFL
ncbi:hypothetical protein [Synechococcus sp. UW179B]|uniref:hypothetical protein n=1 Tax=Synechococcus sp. UW179B TaxID=2575516 RepID=UPI000E0F5C6F|nr:hypothetical protein [Synechococcus sp. UW179B]